MFIEQLAAPHLERPPEVLPRLWLARDLWAGVATALGAFVVLIAAVAFLALGEADLNPTVGAVATLLFELTLGVTVLLLALRRGLSRADLGFVRPQRWGPLATAWLGAYAIQLSYFTVLLVLDALGVPTDLLDDGNSLPIGSEATRVALVIFGVAVIVGAPLGEELMFRALLFRGMRGFWRLVPAMVVSGLLFGLFHLNPSVLVPFTLVGALFAWSYEESGSLWVTIAAHAGANSVAYANTLRILE
jgi:membrane protease YdiL (CAAX protease family)